MALAGEVVAVETVAVGVENIVEEEAIEVAFVVGVEVAHIVEGVGSTMYINEKKWIIPQVLE